MASLPPVGYSKDAARIPCFTYICPSCGRASIPTKMHLLLAAGGLGGQVCAVRAGVVVGVHQVDLGEAGQGRFHLLARVRLEPFHVGLEDDLEGRSP